MNGASDETTPTDHTHLVGFHRTTRAAQSPTTRAEQSNNMWNPSEISPRLLVHTPYSISTTVNPWIGTETLLLLLS